MARKWTLTDDEIRAQIPVARKRGTNAARVEVRARTARYDAESGRVHVELTNGWAVAFPAASGPGLEGAPAKELAEVAVSPSGIGLHWESLDADIDVPALLAQTLGRLAYAASGRIGGSKTSEAKARAARENGMKGGRPRKEPTL